MTTENLTTPVKKQRSNFNLVGEVKLNDYSFKKDIISEKSGYQYSSMNIGVNVGNGLVLYSEGMGGFFPQEKDNKGASRPNRMYVNDKDDFTNHYDISFVDRFDETIIGQVNEMNFFNVGIEKEFNIVDGEKVYTDNIIRKKFLSEYDMVNYLSENLENGMVVNISGNVEYSVYNDEVQSRKKIKNIYLSKKPKEEYKATFTQTILLNKDSIDKKIENDEVTIYAQVPEYVGKIGNTPVKKTLVFPQTYTIPLTDGTKKLMTKYMKAKKGKITEITMEGEYKSSVVVGEVNEDELSPDMKELVDMGLFTLEDAMEKQNQVIKGDRGTEVLMLRKPHVKQGQGENSGVIINYVLDKYDETDLLTHYMFSDEVKEEKITEVPKQDGLEEGDVVVDAEDSDWLNEL